MDVEDFNLCEVEGLPKELKEALGCGTVVNIRDYFKTNLKKTTKKCFGIPADEYNAKTKETFLNKSIQTESEPNFSKSDNLNDYEHIVNLLQNTTLYNYVLRLNKDQPQELPGLPPGNTLQLVIGEYDLLKHKQYNDDVKSKKIVTKAQFETHQGIKHGQLLNHGFRFPLESGVILPKLVFSGTLIQVKENEKYTILINPMSGCWADYKKVLQEDFPKMNLDLFNTMCISHILTKQFEKNSIPCEKYDGDQNICAHDIPKLLEKSSPNQ